MTERVILSMTITWNSLHFLCSDRDRLQNIVRDHLQAAGYALYDPFDGIPGRVYADSVRLFLSPIHDGWTRILGVKTPQGTLEDVLLPALSNVGDCLALSLDDANAGIRAWADGRETDPVTAMTPYLRAGTSAERLRHTLDGVLKDLPQTQVEGVRLDLLPDDVQAMAGKLNPKHVNKLFRKMLGNMGKDADKAKQAGQLLQNLSADWSSEGGQRLIAFMACLPFAEGWRTPDFVALRDAYQLHRRRQRNPNAPLYPGDSEAMRAVPLALDYIPIYGGR